MLKKTKEDLLVESQAIAYLLFSRGEISAEDIALCVYIIRTDESGVFAKLFADLEWEVEPDAGKLRVIKQVVTNLFIDAACHYQARTATFCGVLDYLDYLEDNT